MARFITLRLCHTVLILFGVSVVAFGLIHLIPGSQVDIRPVRDITPLLGSPQPPPTDWQGSASDRG